MNDVTGGDLLAGTADFLGTVRVRERRHDDLDELVAVSARVRSTDGYPLYLPAGDFVGFLTRPEPLGVWVAEHDGAIIGHVALNAQTSQPVMRLAHAVVTDGYPIAFVARLLVDPSARRHGVGARLLDRARCEARARHRIPMLDVVDTPSASAAISLYRREGWREVGRALLVIGGEEVEELVFRGP